MIPVARESLAQVLAPFGRSSTLPSEAYADEGVFRWELEHFFDRTWVCIGRAQDLRAAGISALWPLASSQPSSPGARTAPCAPVANGYLEGEVSRPASRT